MALSRTHWFSHQNCSLLCHSEVSVVEETLCDQLVVGRQTTVCPTRKFRVEAGIHRRILAGLFDVCSRLFVEGFLVCSPLGLIGVENLHHACTLSVERLFHLVTLPQLPMISICIWTIFRICLHGVWCRHLYAAQGTIVSSSADMPARPAAGSQSLVEDLP